jgi:esterase
MANQQQIPFRDIFVEANGLRYHLVAQGAPGTPPVVMIHGLAGQAHAFDAIAAHLAKRLHVYCLDVRGRGESEWGAPDEYHTDTYVADLEAVREALGLERFSLVGTSMGGMISMNYAATYPERVSRLAMNDIGPEVNPSGIARIAQYIGNSPSYFKDMKAVVKYYREHYAPMVEHLAEDQIAEFARHNVRRDDSGLYTWKMDPAIRQMKPVAPKLAPWDAWNAIQCPVLIIRGANSDILARETAEKMAAAHEGTQIVEVQGVGHAPQLTEAAATGALESFLAD